MKIVIDLIGFIVISLLTSLFAWKQQLIVILIVSIAFIYGVRYGVMKSSKFIFNSIKGS